MVIKFSFYAQLIYFQEKDIRKHCVGLIFSSTMDLWMVITQIIAVILRTKRRIIPQLALQSELFFFMIFVSWFASCFCTYILSPKQHCCLQYRADINVSLHICQHAGQTFWHTVVLCTKLYLLPEFFWDWQAVVVPKPHKPWLLIQKA